MRILLPAFTKQSKVNIQSLIFLGLLAFLMIANISYSNAQNVIDIEGNVYQTIQIGKQVWMTSNLKTTRLNNGQEIRLVEDNTTWHEYKEPGYCWYNNSEKLYKDAHGALYNWHTVNTGKLCPKGWHVPTIQEWNILFDYLGGENVAGSKMKTTELYWNRPDPSATGESKFNGLPSGYRSLPGSYHGSSTSIYLNSGETGYWWSSTEMRSINAWYIALSRGFEKVMIIASRLELGHSVRCIKDK